MNRRDLKIRMYKFVINGGHCGIAAFKKEEYVKLPNDICRICDLCGAHKRKSRGASVQLKTVAKEQLMALMIEELLE